MPQIRSTMKAAAVDRFGRPEVLTAHTLDVPKPGPNEILVKLHTSGIGVWDAAIRDGSWRQPGRPSFPLVPGVDGAGLVVATGARVTRFHAGDRVYAYEFGNAKGGFYAEFVAVHQNCAGHVPFTLNLRSAGAAAATGLTAMQGVRALSLRRGQTVLVFGASGAVGTLAVQFARSHCARVIATASGRAAQQLVRRLGADEVFDARAKRGLDRLRAIAPDGLDAVFALAGGNELEACVRLVRNRGRVIYPNGIEPAPRARRRLRVSSFDAKATAKEFAELGRWIKSARLRVPIAAVFPLARAAAAHQRLEAGRVVGRIVLAI